MSASSDSPREDRRRVYARARAREQREHYGWSQEELARRTGVANTRTINRFENGAAWPHGRTRRAIERALGWSPGSLDWIDANAPQRPLDPPEAMIATTAGPSLPTEKELIYRGEIMALLNLVRAEVANRGDKVLLNELDRIIAQLGAQAMAYRAALQSALEDGPHPAEGSTKPPASPSVEQ